MKYYYLIIILLGLTISSKGQSAVNSAAGFNSNGSIDGIIQGFRYFENENPSLAIDGTRYVFPEWQKASIRTINQQQFDHVEIRYDASSNDFEMKKGSKIIILNDALIDQIKLIDLGYTFKLSHSASKKHTLVIYEFSDGKELVQQFSASIQRANYNPALNVGSKTDKWIVKPQTYLKQGKSLKKIRLNKKSVYSLIPSDKIQEAEKVESVYDWSDAYSVAGFLKEINL